MPNMRAGDGVRKNLVRIALGLLFSLVFFGHSVNFYQIPLLATLDAFVYDARLRMTMPGGLDDRVAIVDIDEKSLAELGRWPWGRDRLASLVDRLFDEYGVALLGFDITFAEPDTSSGLPVLRSLASTTLKDNPAFLDALESLRGSLDHDERFAASLRNRPVVLGYYFNHLEKSGALPPPVLPPGVFAGRRIDAYVRKGFGGNLALFQQNASAAGHFNPGTEFDGISRRVPMLIEHEGQYYEALSLAMVRVLLGSPPLVPWFPDGNPKHGAEWLELPGTQGTLRIPVDEQLSTLIPYRGPQRSFRYFPAADVLAGRLKADDLRGRIVLVGTTSPGLMDLRATPVGGVFPGVEVHANLVAGILDGSLKQKPPYVLGADMVQIVFAAGLMAFLMPLLSPLGAVALAGGLLASVTALNFLLWHFGLVLPLAAVFTAIIGLYALNTSWGFFVESRSKRQMAGLFGQYVPPELVEEMARDPERYSMEGRRDELTVLFSDVRGFTSIAEKLDSRELSLLMNEYLGAMTRVVQRNRGTLDKYIGDAIMAFWGAPVADSEHVRHALATALEMQRALRALDAPFQARGWPVLHVGIGVNVGAMTVGDMGSPVRRAYTVMGDSVNLASRLEGLTKHYGVNIIVSESVRQQAKDLVYRELDRVRVKGKDEPVAIYELVGFSDESSERTREELRLWGLALRFYRAQDWDQAELQLYNLSRLYPEKALYALYSGRISRFRESPPGQDWDGVTTFETK